MPWSRVPLAVGSSTRRTFPVPLTSIFGSANSPCSLTGASGTGADGVGTFPGRIAPSGRPRSSATGAGTVPLHGACVPAASACSACGSIKSHASYASAFALSGMRPARPHVRIGDHLQWAAAHLMASRPRRGPNTRARVAGRGRRCVQGRLRCGLTVTPAGGPCRRLP